MMDELFPLIAGLLPHWLIAALATALFVSCLPRLLHEQTAYTGVALTIAAVAVFYWWQALTNPPDYYRLATGRVVVMALMLALLNWNYWAYQRRRRGR